MVIKNIFAFTYKLFLTLNIILVVISIFLMYLINQNLHILKNNKIELASKKYDLQNLDQLVADRKALQERYPLLAKSLPSSYRSIAFFIKKTEELADKQKIEMQTLASEDKNEKRFNVVSVSQKLASSYQDLANYLISLTDLPYHTILNTLNMKSGETVINYYLLVEDQID